VEGNSELGVATAVAGFLVVKADLNVPMKPKFSISVQIQLKAQV